MNNYVTKLFLIRFVQILILIGALLWTTVLTALRSLPQVRSGGKRCDYR